MAFSGRARRPGAFSSNAKPAEALSDAPFVGEWIDEDDELVTIKNSKIHASDGGTMDLNVKSATEASFKMDGEVYHGSLSADGGKITWSDGAAWTRKGQKAGGAAAGAADAAEEQRKAEAAKKAAEDEAARKQIEDAKQKAQELARKKAEDEAMAKKAAALEKAKAAAAAAEAKAAGEAAAKADEPSSAAGSGMDQEKARIEAGLDKAKQAFEAEKARRAAALERAKAARAAQEAAKAAEADDSLGEAKAKSEAGMDKARAAFEAEKARKAAALERARAAKEEAEKKKEEAAKEDAADAAKTRSDAGLDKARSAFEAEKARKAAALEKARAAKAAAEAASAEKPAEDSKPSEAQAKSQAGLDKARAAFEAEKARKAAALEKARAAKAAAEQEAAEAKAAPGGKDVDEAKAKSDAGLNKARAAFEAEKARKAAALEKARAAKAAQEAAEKEAQDKPANKDFEQAKAKSTAGLDKARAAFEAEKARKQAALEKARAKAAEAAAGGGDDDEDEEPPSLTTASGAKRGSAFSSALNKAQPAPEPQTFTGPPKGKTLSAFSTAGAPQELGPPDAGSPDVEVVTEVVQLSEADFEPGIVVKLQGLKTKPELNGQWGVLVEFSEAKKRWSVRIDGMEDMALRAENLQAVSQEEYDAWMAEQANAEASAKYEMEAMLKSQVCGGKTRWTDSDAGKIARKPGENGNEFDICMGVEPDGQRAARKVADIMKDKGVCLVEANAPPDLLYQAYEEAEKLWKGGEFHPPMQDFGASELEMTIWHQVLFQDESKAKWVGEDAGEKMQALGLLGQNLRDFAQGLGSVIGQKLNINFTNLWDSMLVCYTGDRSYSFHIDNPCMADENSLPDNGLRLTLAYFINPHWSPENGYNGGGLDVYMSPPSGPPESLTKARKCDRVRIAPHADTLVVFPSQRMAHQVISTKGKELWFCLWMWCFDEEVMESFPRRVHQKWQGQGGEAHSPRGSDQGGEEDDEEVIDD